MKKFELEVQQGERFQFGKNWISFLKTLDQNGIEFAKKSMISLLGCSELSGKTFLDIGSGSGLSSLVAKIMGATVTSIDYDPDSVNSTKMLKNEYFRNDDKWTIEQASVLDKKYLQGLGQFDIVYSWGVLHHTGKMWEAFENVFPLVKTDGILFLAIYNDQAYKSRFWWKVKKMYNSSNAGKLLMCSIFLPLFFTIACFASIKSKENIFIHYKKNRGMSIIHDWQDWLGGFPFEVAKIEDVFSYFKSKGFSLYNIKTTTSMGCNEFVFRK